jgi:hypothetical protein
MKEWMRKQKRIVVTLVCKATQIQLPSTLLDNIVPLSFAQVTSAQLGHF